MTDRLRLEPIRRTHAADLWRLHQDPGIAEWYAGTWTEDDAASAAARFDDAWRTEGVGKWMAYHRKSGELVGRGGLSRIDLGGRPRLEIGWAIRSALWGSGYATEIGRAGLAYAFGDLGAADVVAFTERHNAASRAVMERLAMCYAGEIRRAGLVEGLAGVHEDAPFALYVLAAPGADAINAGGSARM